MASVTLSVLPFGTSQAPFFDGALGSVLTIPDDPQYSQPFSNALTVAAWLCLFALNNANVVGEQDKYVRYVEKAVAESVDAQWALRFYNQLNETRHSRLSFYTFNLGSPTREGNGSYMEYGVSKNDETPIALGQWGGRALDFADGSFDGLRALETRRRGEARNSRSAPGLRRTPTARVRLDCGRGLARNRPPGGGRASGDLEPPALGQRNRLDLERRRERAALRDVPQLRLSG